MGVFIGFTAGMVSTTWVQFIKGSLLVIFCFVLTVLILGKGLVARPEVASVLVPREQLLRLDLTELTYG